MTINVIQHLSKTISTKSEYDTLQEIRLYYRAVALDCSSFSYVQLINCKPVLSIMMVTKYWRVSQLCINTQSRFDDVAIARSRTERAWFIPEEG